VKEHAEEIQERIIDFSEYFSPDPWECLQGGSVGQEGSNFGYRIDYRLVLGLGPSWAGPCWKELPFGVDHSADGGRLLYWAAP